MIGPPRPPHRRAGGVGRVARGLVASVVGSLALLGSGRAAHASPEDLFGYGPRSPALGGTGIAHAEGFDAAWANPALLSRMRARRLTLGFQGATFDLHAEGEGLPGRVSTEAAHGYVIGADLPIPLGGLLRDRIGVGFAFYTPTDVLVRGRIVYPERPQFALLSDRAQSLMARFGFGLDFGRGVRAGLGFAALAEIAGDVIVATDASGKVGSRVEDQLVANYAPTAGVSWEHALAGGELRVGAVYRGSLDARFSITIDGTKLSSLSIPLLNIAGVAQYDPAELGLEAAWKKGGWLAAVGAVYKRWSDYPGLVEPTILCPADEPDCGALAPTRPGFSDTLVPHAGVERTFAAARGLDVHLRAGYFLEPSPVPDRLEPSAAYDPSSRGLGYVPNRFFDGTRHVFTVGWGVTLDRPLPPIRLDTFAQLHAMPAHTVDVAADASGPNVGAFGPARISGTVLAAGMLAGVSF